MTAAILLLALLQAPPAGEADEVWLVSGDRISGRVVELGNGTLVVRSP